MSARQTILVTGATGFLGGRVVERLVAQGVCDVRVMVRAVGRAVRVASLPVNYCLGDVTDVAAFTAAARGCDAVIHCASKIDGKVPEKTSTFLGVMAAAQACKAVGARLVHISSCSVYGVPGTAIVDETAAMRPRHSKDMYGLAKIAAERFLKAFAADTGLRAVILQPTMIYGPFSEEWTVAPLAMLRAGNVAMPEGDTGVCNAVYVDDVVSAALLALEKCDESCQEYLINGDELPSWADFLGRYASLGTSGSVVRLSAEEMAGLVRESKKGRSFISTSIRILREQPAVRSAVASTALVAKTFGLMQKWCPPKALDAFKGRLIDHTKTEAPVVHFTQLGQMPTRLPAPHFLELAKQSHRYSIEKAQRELRYVPEFSLDRSFEVMGAWGRWSGMVR